MACYSANIPNLDKPKTQSHVTPVNKALKKTSNQERLTHLQKKRDHILIMNSLVDKNKQISASMLSQKKSKLLRDISVLFATPHYSNNNNTAGF